MDENLVPIIDYSNSKIIKYLSKEEVKKIFNLEFSLNEDISMNIKCIMNKPIIFKKISLDNNETKYDQLIYLTFRYFDEEFNDFKFLNIILIIQNHFDENNKFILILSYKNLKEQFDIYSDFDTYYNNFVNIFSLFDNSKDATIYFIDDESNEPIILKHLSHLKNENQSLFNTIISSLAKFSFELDSSETKLFNPEDNFSWSELLSDYFINLK